MNWLRWATLAAACEASVTSPLSTITCDALALHAATGSRSITMVMPMRVVS
jgi:hypothetical protein